MDPFILILHKDELDLQNDRTNSIPAPEEYTCAKRNRPLTNDLYSDFAIGQSNHHRESFVTLTDFSSFTSADKGA